MVKSFYFHVLSLSKFSRIGELRHICIFHIIIILIAVCRLTVVASDVSAADRFFN